MPTPSVAGTPGFFAHGSAGGQPYTVLSSDWGNAVQMEICNVITASGQTLSKTTQNQLLTAIQSLGRIKLTTTLNMYVAANGDDTNNGLTLTTPLKTLQQAIWIIYGKYDLAAQTVIVNVGNGTYTAGASHSLPLNGFIKFIGNPINPSLCKIQLTAGGNCFAAGNSAYLWINGFALEAQHGTAANPIWSTADIGLWSGNGAILLYENIAFGPMTYAHMWTGNGAEISVPSEHTKYSIYGGAVHHMVASNGSVVSVASTICTITGVPAFSGAFAYADAAGYIWAPFATYNPPSGPIGAATGTKYFSFNGSLVNTNGGGPNFFPGSLDGISTTGYYQ
jgi:hypothetical protein